MRLLAVIALSLLLSCPSARAQINVQSEDGSSVSIGPNGITVNGKATGSRANVQLGPGGIRINSDNGSKRANVNLGPGLKVETNKRTAAKTVTTYLKTTAVNTATRTKRATGSSSSEQVTLIEMKVYGKSSSGMPLMTRVEKLEIDNLGQKGNGPLKTRINVLAKELGVTLTATSTTIVNSQNSTIEITSPGAEAMTIKIKEDASHHSSVVSGTELSNMVINESNQLIKGNCNGNSIILNGNNCQLLLSGKLAIVTINGNNNHVKSERIGMVVANGNSNSVTWSHQQGAPRITNNGRDNNMHAQ